MGPIEEQRLLAYKKEGKSWNWIFTKFPERSQPAIRTHWNMVRPGAVTSVTTSKMNMFNMVHIPTFPPPLAHRPDFEMNFKNLQRIYLYI